MPESSTEACAVSAGSVSVETAAVAVGKAVGKHVVIAWLADRPAEQERDSGLVGLVQARFPDRIMRRRAAKDPAPVTASGRPPVRNASAAPDPAGGRAVKEVADLLHKRCLPARQLSERVFSPLRIGPSLS
jgi:hypothetical protein